jgi:DNA-binding winged helix-turn-helix (wHTH) protein
VFVFGEFSFSAESHELRRGGVVVHLQRQPAVVLEYLLENAGRVVSREELVNHVWKAGHHVDYGRSLNYCIREIRRALGEQADGNGCLETRPRQGYRWVARVVRTAPVGERAANAGSRIDEGLHPPAAVHIRQSRFAIAALVATVCVLLTTGLQAPFEERAHPARRPQSHLGQALNALHLLAHAAVEPERNIDTSAALQTLWVVVASHVGLASDGALESTTALLSDAPR